MRSVASALVWAFFVEGGAGGPEGTDALWDGRDGRWGGALGNALDGAAGAARSTLDVDGPRVAPSGLSAPPSTSAMLSPRSISECSSGIARARSNRTASGVERSQRYVSFARMHRSRIFSPHWDARTRS
jgi:hypothetical protein